MATLLIIAAPGGKIPEEAEPAAAAAAAAAAMEAEEDARMLSTPGRTDSLRGLCEVRFKGFFFCGWVIPEIERIVCEENVKEMKSKTV